MARRVLEGEDTANSIWFGTCAVQQERRRWRVTSDGGRTLCRWFVVCVVWHGVFSSCYSPCIRPAFTEVFSVVPTEEEPAILFTGPTANVCMWCSVHWLCCLDQAGRGQDLLLRAVPKAEQLYPWIVWICILIWIWISTLSLENIFTKNWHIQQHAHLKCLIAFYN